MVLVARTACLRLELTFAFFRGRPGRGETALITPFSIQRPPASRPDTVGKTLSRFRQLNRVRIRRLSRRAVSGRIRVAVYREDGSLYDEGSAELLDLSSAGARIGRLSLPLGDILPPSSLVTLSFSGYASRESGVRGEVVWFRPDDGRTYGIRFMPASR